MTHRTHTGLRRAGVVPVTLTLVALLACSRGDERAIAEQAGVPARPASIAAAPDQFHAGPDVRLRYRDAGPESGTAIVFIHGYSRALEDWTALADSLDATHRVIAFDVRGFGQSSKFASAAQYGAKMGDDIIGLMDSLGIRRAHLVGHSMGALIAASVASRYPDRVFSASLIAGPFHPDSASTSRETVRWVRDLERGVGFRRFLTWLFPGLPDSMAVGMSRETMAQNDSVALVESMRSMGGLAVPTATAARATVPAFIAVGGGDPLAPLSRSLAKTWPSAKFVEVPGVDHGAIIARPEVLAGIRALVDPN